jgi:O-antigen chain-terminating methyltransferase
MTEPLEATLRRLEQEREEADRRYNEALTAVDRALRPPPGLPPAPPAYDEHQITPLNEAWNILPGPPPGSGIRGRLAAFVWRTIGPYLERQLTFNSRLVDHVNRNAAAHREAQRSLDALLARLQETFAAQADLQSRLMVLLQQITPYVDTRDRQSAGGALVLNASQSALAESFGKRWESVAARTAHRDARCEARTDALARSQDELKTAVNVAQQAALTVKRELERRAPREPPIAPAPQAEAAPPGGRPGETFTGALDAYKYVGFEDQFRGSREVIRTRLESYLPIFEGASGVLDVGCGRGEFLDLLAARGIRARGIDPNPEMAEVCRARGLDVTTADAVGYLSSLEDGSLGGLFAAQVVEHLQPSYLLRFLELSFHKLAAGAPLVLETLNPACWVAFFESYIRDITHVWPLHPETLQYLAVASGFTGARIEYRSPVPPEDRLQVVAAPAGADQTVADLVDVFNGNVQKLNARMFTDLDYAVIAAR